MWEESEKKPLNSAFYLLKQKQLCPCINAKFMKTPDKIKR